MWHVLEHVHALKPYLNQCFKSLKYNGRLIIAVPNYTSFDARFYKNIGQLMIYQDIYTIFHLNQCLSY
jgi:predicted SAM-dependent methyltransferase